MQTQINTDIRGWFTFEQKVSLFAKITLNIFGDTAIAILSVCLSATLVTHA